VIFYGADMTSTTQAGTGSNTAAMNAITAAIHSANVRVNGARFDPFKIKIANADFPSDDPQIGKFQPIWTSERGNTPMQFFQYQPGPNDSKAFLPLGDIAIVGKNPSANNSGGMVFASDNAAALAHPTGFTWILDDHGSGNPADVKYFWPIAPPGYTALGVCFSNGDAPDPSHYWCVANEYVVATTGNGYWSDAGQGWKSHNGDLHVPALPKVSTSQLALAPTTFYSAEGGQTPQYLLVNQCVLGLSAPTTPDPAYFPGLAISDTTDVGVSQVAVLPYSAVADTGFQNQSLESPFYYLASQTQWLCTDQLSAPDGGSQTVSSLVGVTQSDATSFSSSTSLTVSAEVGVEFDGLSSKVSTSYTQTFGYETSSSTTNDTQTSTATTVNLPKAEKIFLWNQVGVLQVFRDNLQTPQNGSINYRMSASYVLAAPAGS
jgi:hypothetical protein